jgi:cyanophycinase
MTGPLALVGGDEWNEGCNFDRGLLEVSGGREVVVIPAAAAYIRPQRAIERARAWFDQLGATVVAPPVLLRPDAADETSVSIVRNARFVYLTDGSSMHLRSVLKDTPVFDALMEAWRGGAVLAGSGAGADVLCDPMVDPRGGAFTVGLGVVPGLAVIPRFDTWSREKVHRTVELAPSGVKVAGVSLRTALLRNGEGHWRCEGVGEVAVWVDGQPTELSALDALTA